MEIFKPVLVALSLLVPVLGQAADAPMEQFKKEFGAKFPQVEITGISESPVKGLYQVEMNDSNVVYVSTDGKFLVTGDLLDITTPDMVNLSEEWRSKKRVDMLHELKDQDMVVYPAEGKEKADVLVFTDTSCGYCRKFHTEIPELNKMGITVKYLAWPRAGLQSPAGQTMVNIWCANDRESAMTAAKSSKPVSAPAGKVCDQHVLQDQLNLGQVMGVRGTPAVFSEDGRQLGGYLKASELADKLGVQ